MLDDRGGAIRLRERQGTVEQGVDDREDGGSGADAERERKHRHRREAGALGELAERVAEVTHIAAPPSDRPASPGARGAPRREERRYRARPVRCGTSLDRSVARQTTSFAAARSAPARRR